MGRRMETAVAKEQRMEAVASLLVRGLTYREISREVGLSIGAISGYVKAIRAEWREERLDSLEEYTTQQLVKLAALEAPMMEQALEGNQRAVDRCLRILERQSALLGLDAPKKHEHKVLIAQKQGEIIASVIAAVLEEQGIDTSNPEIASSIETQLMLAAGEMVEGEEIIDAEEVVEVAEAEGEGELVEVAV